MALKIFGLAILSSAELATLKTFALTEGEKAVAALKQTDIGKTVAADIAAAANADLTGMQKFEQVLTNTLPLIQALFTKQGQQVEMADLEDVGRSLVQTVYNDVKSTTVGTWAAGILKLLGIG
jgi:hypothetical protein